MTLETSRGSVPLYSAYRDALSFRHTDWPTEPTLMVNLFRSYPDRHKLQRVAAANSPTLYNLGANREGDSSRWLTTIGHGGSG